MTVSEVVKPHQLLLVMHIYNDAICILNRICGSDVHNPHTVILHRDLLDNTNEYLFYSIPIH